MRYIVFSLFVIGFLISLLYCSLCVILKMVRNIRKKELKNIQVVLSVLCVCVTILSCALLGNYTYPFERKLNPILIEEITLEPDDYMEHPNFWRGIYKKNPLYGGEHWFNINGSIHGYELSQLDIDHHSYVITYGQKIVSLSYNVWDNVQYKCPGSKEGHIVLEEEFSPDKIYIYQIPKMRLNVDLNTWFGREEN